MLFDELETRKGKRDQTYNITSGGKSGGGKSGGGDLPEVVVKVASNINHNSASNTLDYISRNKENDEKEFVPLEDEMGNILNPDEVKELGAAWKKEFEQDKRENSRKMTHFVISIDSKNNERNAEKLRIATREILQQRLGEQGFRYTFAIHNDTEKLHAHVVVNNYNLETKRKLRINEHWLNQTRKEAVNQLSKVNLKHRATMKNDRIETVQEKAKAVEKPKDQILAKSWYEAKIKTDCEKNKNKYDKMIARYDLLNEIQKNPQVKITSSIQKRIDQAKKETLEYNSSLKSKTNKDIYFRTVLKDMNVSKENIDNAKRYREERTAYLQAKVEKSQQAYAKKLIKNELEIKADKSLNRVDRNEKLSVIRIKKDQLSKKGVDIEAAEKELKQQNKRSEPYQESIKIINKAMNGTDRAIDSEKFDQASAEKRIYRMLDDLSKHQVSSRKERKDIAVSKQELYSLNKSNGVDANEIEKKWAVNKDVRDRLASLKTDLSQNEKPIDLKKTQNEIEQLKKEVKEAARNKKELFAMQKGLRFREQELVDRQGEAIANPSKLIDKQLTKLERLNKETDVKPEIKERNDINLAKDFLAVERISKNKPELENKVNQLKEKLLDSGVDIEAGRKRALETEKLKNNIESINETLANPPKIVKFKELEENIEKMKNSLVNTDLNVTKQREMKVDFNKNSDDLKNLKKERINVISENIDLVEKYLPSLHQKTNENNLSKLSSLEKLENKKQHDKETKKLNDLIKEATANLPLIEKDKIRKNKIRELNRLRKEVEQSSLKLKQQPMVKTPQQAPQTPPQTVNKTNVDNSVLKKNHVSQQPEKPTVKTPERSPNTPTPNVDNSVLKKNHQTNDNQSIVTLRKRHEQKQAETEQRAVRKENNRPQTDSERLHGMSKNISEISETLTKLERHGNKEQLSYLTSAQRLGDQKQHEEKVKQLQLLIEKVKKDLPLNKDRHERKQIEKSMKNAEARIAHSIRKMAKVKVISGNDYSSGQVTSPKTNSNSNGDSFGIVKDLAAKLPELQFKTSQNYLMTLTKEQKLENQKKNEFEVKKAKLLIAKATKNVPEIKNDLEKQNTLKQLKELNQILNTSVKQLNNNKVKNTMEIKVDKSVNVTNNVTNVNSNNTNTNTKPQTQAPTKTKQKDPIQEKIEKLKLIAAEIQKREDPKNKNMLSRTGKMEDKKTINESYNQFKLIEKAIKKDMLPLSRTQGLEIKKSIAEITKTINIGKAIER